MNEKISRLMDGELDGIEFDSCCAQLGSADARAAWLAYHVIGDHLRGAASGQAGGAAFMARMSAVLAAEPTILAPAPAATRKASQPATFAWAVAATIAAVTVVGWTAYSMVDVPPTGIAKVREAATMRASAPARVPAGDVPNEYLLAHQEYSPLALQGGAPYLRSASATAPVAVEERH